MCVLTCCIDLKDDSKELSKAVFCSVMFVPIQYAFGHFPMHIFCFLAGSSDTLQTNRMQRRGMRTLQLTMHARMAIQRSRQPKKRCAHNLCERYFVVDRCLRFAAKPVKHSYAMVCTSTNCKWNESGAVFRHSRCFRRTSRLRGFPFGCCAGITQIILASLLRFKTCFFSESVTVAMLLGFTLTSGSNREAPMDGASSWQ